MDDLFLVLTLAFASLKDVVLWATLVRARIDYKCIVKVKYENMGELDKIASLEYWLEKSCQSSWSELWIRE